MPEVGESTVKEKAAEAYTLRIFLSVDVSGSTAFKFSNAVAGAPVSSLKGAGWVEVIQKFYGSFDEKFKQQVYELASPPTFKLWKALGDELIYQAEIRTRVEAAELVQCFITAIHYTRRIICAESPRLDLKAAAWTADFPGHNAVVIVNGLLDPYDPKDREARIKAEKEAGDFIGPSMDIGFRIGKIASRRRMALSVELAAILAAPAPDGKRYIFQFGYDGREDLKGVLGGEAYPAIWIDIEDDRGKRETIRREAAMLQRQPHLSAETVLDFCVSYIGASQWLEFPYFKDEAADRDTVDKDPLFAEVPPSHLAKVRREMEVVKLETGLYQPVDAPDSAVTDEPDITVETLLHDMQVKDVLERIDALDRRAQEILGSAAAQGPKPSQPEPAPQKK